MIANLSVRARRSVLYVPGNNARALDKATNLPVDGLILDLEDAVPAGAKASARAAVLTAVAARPFGHREVVIRINALDAEWGADDLREAARSGADAILLPKVEGRITVRDADALLEAAGAPDNLALWAMVETPRGVLAVQEIAACSRRMRAIVMGTADLGTALRVPEDPGRRGLVPALSTCVLAARAAGLDILDGIYAHFADAVGFRGECEQGRLLGFDGKTLIHPGQIEDANEIFGVSAAEAASATRLIAAWDAAAADGDGVAVVEGRMVERLHAEDAQRRLALHRATQDRLNGR